MEEFKVGDRVECVRKSDHITVGQKGTVCVLSSSMIGVEWEDYHERNHICCGYDNGICCKDGHGWFMEPKGIKKIKENEMNIGDRVWVSDDSEEDAKKCREERIFVAYDEGNRFPYHVVKDTYEDHFKDNDVDFYQVLKYKYAVPVEVEEMSFKLTLNGKKIDPKDISEETWNKLRG